jgi:hypothetical protein
MTIIYKGLECKLPANLGLAACPFPTLSDVFIYGNPFLHNVDILAHSRFSTGRLWRQGIMRNIRTFGLGLARPNEPFRPSACGLYNHSPEVIRYVGTPDKSALLGYENSHRHSGAGEFHCDVLIAPSTAETLFPLRIA